jgi:hypothetical protein
MERIKPCTCGSHAKLRKVSGASYAVVCPVCGATGERVWLDENHTLCEVQNMAIAEWNGGNHEKSTA